MATAQERFNIATRAYGEAKKTIWEMSSLVQKHNPRFSAEIALRQFDYMLQYMMLEIAIADLHISSLESQFAEKITEKGDILSFVRAKTEIDVNWKNIQWLDEDSVRTLLRITKRLIDDFVDEFVTSFAMIDAVTEKNYMRELSLYIAKIAEVFTGIDGRSDEMEWDVFLTRVSDLLLSRWTKVKALAKNKYIEKTNDTSAEFQTNALVQRNQFAVKSARRTLACNGRNLVGIKTDGTIAVLGAEHLPEEYKGVLQWTNIVSIAIGESHIVGLRVDGSVIAAGNNYDGECEVEDWHHIVAIAAGKSHTVGLKSDGTVVAVGDNIDGQCEVFDWNDIVAIVAGEHTVGLKKDGTVATTQHESWMENPPSHWTGIVGVAASGSRTVGIKADGTVVENGSSTLGEGDISMLTGVLAVSTSGFHTVGLKKDKTAIAIGYGDSGQCKVADWRNIVSLFATDFRTIGLQSDGSVVLAGLGLLGGEELSNWKIALPPDESTFEELFEKERGQAFDIRRQARFRRNEFAIKNAHGTIAACDFALVGVKPDGEVVVSGLDELSEYHAVRSWRQIVAVSATKDFIVGLKADGSVVAVGDNFYGQCDVSGWRDIIAVAAGESHTVGLKADGTVVAIGNNGQRQCEVFEWSDIVAIAAGEHTVGLKKDGTVVTTQRDSRTEQWRDIVAIAVGANGKRVVGINANGIAVESFHNVYDCGEILEINNSTDIAMSDEHTVGLREDGTVVAVGYNGAGECDVSTWSNVVKVVANKFRTVGLKSDGSVVVAGSQPMGEKEVASWRLALPIEP